MEQKPVIAVIGGNQPTPGEAKVAQEVGRRLAEQGAILVCGGLGGVMEAVCKGASDAGGTTIGILPGNNSKAANPYVQIPIVTGIGYARNVIVVKSSQVVIAIGGSYGTLTEIGHALQSGIPVVGLNTWSIARNGKPDQSIIEAPNPAEAVDLALDLARDNLTN
ncbi:MAG: TIGR00725 family protein [Dehalococcoidales bacterium]|nr:TIGR00725 family protein [Dehalococcoidales bacterium]